MKYTLVISQNALDDIKMHKKAGNKSLLRKIQTLLNELRMHPASGTGQPEKLKHDLSGLYSRRINNKHRLVYSIKEKEVLVYVLSAASHYGDK